jgi:hypothetical protein
MYASAPSLRERADEVAGFHQDVPELQRGASFRLFEGIGVCERCGAFVARSRGSNIVQPSCVTEEQQRRDLAIDVTPARNNAIDRSGIRRSIVSVEYR